MDGDAACDAGFHGQIDARADGRVPHLGAAQRHQFLVCRHHGLPARDGTLHHLARDVCAPYQFSHDLYVGPLDQLTPIRRSINLPDSQRELLRLHRAAAHRFDGEPES